MQGGGLSLGLFLPRRPLFPVPFLFFLPHRFQCSLFSRLVARFGVSLHRSGVPVLRVSLNFGAPLSFEPPFLRGSFAQATKQASKQTNHVHPHLYTATTTTTNAHTPDSPQNTRCARALRRTRNQTTTRSTADAPDHTTRPPRLASF